MSRKLHKVVQSKTVQVEEVFCDVCGIKYNNCNKCEICTRDICHACTTYHYTEPDNVYYHCDSCGKVFYKYLKLEHDLETRMERSMVMLHKQRDKEAMDKLNGATG